MADRQRTTWQGSGDKAATRSQPVLPVERARAASAHPATPDEGAAHPAYQPDPTQPSDYENGDTSSWAEDPTKGPYPNSAHPATPDEGAAHPAHRQSERSPNEPGGQQMTNDDLGVSKAAAKELRAAVERKAAKCIRIASKLLGAKATVAAVEDQALDFMDMSDAAVQTTLGRLAAEESDEDASDDEDESKKASDDEDEDDDLDASKKASDERLLRRLLAEEEADEDEDEDESGKEASQDLTASEKILAAIVGLGSRIDALETGKTSASDDDVLAGLLAEEEEPVAMDEGVEEDVEALLMSMIDGEGDVAGCGDEMTMDDDYGMSDGSLGIDMGMVEDPMGLLGEVELEGDEEALLAQLFADSRMASDDEDEDEDEGKQAAARLPRPKKASANGATRLGRVNKEAGSDIRELEKLWPTAPDVTGVFG